MEETQTLAWARPRESGPTVWVVGGMPALEGLPPRESRKVRPGEPYVFGVDVVVEPTSHFGKVATVSSPVPGSATFEIVSDEGKTVGGEGTAPTPLAYFTAGVAFCLMTHITGFLKRRPLAISRLRVELRANYWTKLGHVSDAGEPEGGCSGFDVCVLLESSEPPEALRELIVMCERACIASQTVAVAVPRHLRVVVNAQST